MPWFYGQHMIWWASCDVLWLRSDGTVVPIGKPQNTGVSNPAGYTLNYNEFVVYDSRQIKMRYALQVRFDFWGQRWLDTTASICVCLVDYVCVNVISNDQWNAAISS